MVEDLFGEVHPGGEVDAVHLLHVLAEPHVERVRGCGYSEQRGGEIVGFEENDRDIAGRSRLDPCRFAGDAVAGPRGAVAISALALLARQHLHSLGIGGAGEQGKGKADRLAHGMSSRGRCSVHRGG